MKTVAFSLRDRLVAALRFGTAFAIAAAAVLAGLFAGIDWYQNPGGIFRSEAGTRWQFVFDTWLSWFAPALLPLLLGGTVVRFLMTKAIRPSRSEAPK